MTRYEVVFENSFANDVTSMLLYEMHVLGSYEKACERLDHLLDTISDDLSTFPERNPERHYGYTQIPRRVHSLGRYLVIYWVDHRASKVRVERIIHQRSRETQDA